MEAKELRIGNWVMGNSKPYIITALHFAKFNMLQCKPIPLTEEWLVKFGFEMKRKTFYEFGIYLIGMKNNRWYFITSGIAEIELNHVHQLQNLYFALTGGLEL